MKTLVIKSLILFLTVLSTMPLLAQLDTATFTRKTHISLYTGWNRGFSRMEGNTQSEFVYNGFNYQRLSTGTPLLDYYIALSDIGIKLSRVHQKREHRYVRSSVALGISSPVSIRNTVTTTIEATELTEEELDWFEDEEMPLAFGYVIYDRGYGIEGNISQAISICNLHSKSKKRGIVIEALYGMSFYYLPQKALAVSETYSYSTDKEIEVLKIEISQKRTSPIAIAPEMGLGIQFQKNKADGLRFDIAFRQGLYTVYKRDVNYTNRFGSFQESLISRASNLSLRISYPFRLK